MLREAIGAKELTVIPDGRCSDINAIKNQVIKRQKTPDAIVTYQGLRRGWRTRWRASSRWREGRAGWTTGRSAWPAHATCSSRAALSQYVKIEAKMLIHFTMIWWTRSEYMMWEPQHDAKGVTGRTDDGPDDVHGVDGKWRGRFSYSVIRIIRNWRKISTWRYFLGLCGLALPLPRFLTEVNVRLPDEPLAAHRLLRLRRVHKHTDTQASKVIVSKMKK